MEPSRYWHRRNLLATGMALALSLSPRDAARAAGPVISSVAVQNGRVLVYANVPEGFGHVVLRARTNLVAGAWESLVAGGLSGGEAIVSFSAPVSGPTGFLSVLTGAEAAVPPSSYSGPAYFNVVYPNDAPLTEEQKLGHVLNRLGYGASPESMARVSASGPAAYIEGQLNSASADDSDNPALNDHADRLFAWYQPAEDAPLIQAGESWRYFKGVQAPPADWKAIGFNDATWLEGPSGIGYGDDDDETVLEDMRQTATQPGYLSYFLRKRFDLTEPGSVGDLILRVDYDDGFVAYLNGVEVARENVAGESPAYNQPAETEHEAGQPVEYNLTPHKALLRAGPNVLALEVHNVSLTSSDASMTPELARRTWLPYPPEKRIKGLSELQQLAHVEAVYSRRQLQTALAEFWDNHFTTDYNKIADYLDDLRDSDGSDAMSSDQAAGEAAQAEYLEHQFFYDHALGNFGDLLLYSATSPAMLIYLDSVLNKKGAPNENYAREIMELFAFGVDNRYSQADIEQLAKCFTGWTVRKAWPDQRQTFPASARTPPTTPGVLFEDAAIIENGPGWKYFKGRQEPTPDAAGVPTLAWTQPGFDDRAWLDGATSIGYGDNDDATVLADMRNQYPSVYLRRAFSIPDPTALQNLILAVDYDDGFVAYLNGVEVARSRSMANTGDPPPSRATASASHEALQSAEPFSLKAHASLLRPAPQVNVLSIQVHNVTLDSSDVSIHARLVERRSLPGSIENGNLNGSWTFRFDPEEHDQAAKRLFPGTPQEINIPAGRAGVDGLKDALEVIDAMVAHPSTREFICLKLINKFVSDQITLQSYRNETAPEGLRELMDAALAAWMSTSPPGNIQTVMRAILQPAAQDNYFWTAGAYRAKIKTAFEFINSSLRALDADLQGGELPAYNDRAGMRLFEHEMPDGWSELGFDWMDTGSLLERINFVQALANNTDSGMTWDLDALLGDLQDRSAEGIVAHFNQRLFQNALSSADQAVLVRYASTDAAGNPLPLDPNRNDFKRRVQDLVGLMLAAPQWHNQ